MLLFPKSEESRHSAGTVMKPDVKTEASTPSFPQLHLLSLVIDRPKRGNYYDFVSTLVYYSHNSSLLHLTYSLWLNYCVFFRNPSNLAIVGGLIPCLSKA